MLLLPAGLGHNLSQVTFFKSITHCPSQPTILFLAHKTWMPSKVHLQSNLKLYSRKALMLQKSYCQRSLSSTIPHILHLFRCWISLLVRKHFYPASSREHPLTTGHNLSHSGYSQQFSLLALVHMCGSLWQPSDRHLWWIVFRGVCRWWGGNMLHGLQLVTVMLTKGYMLFNFNSGSLPTFMLLIPTQAQELLPPSM